jgi:outer membrane protein OmpA-like peptidoglycan-associated protein
MFRIACIGFLLLSHSALLQAQKTTVVHHYPVDTTGLSEGKIIPARTEEHRIVINYYDHADRVHLDQFQQLISSYLSLYIERCAYIDQGDVKLHDSKKETMRKLNGIVKGALEFYAYESLKDFKGFSPMVEQKLQAIAMLDFSEIEFSSGNDDEAAEQRMRLNYLDKELSDLKLLVNMEVGIYGTENLMVVKGSEEIMIDHGAHQQLLDQYLGGEKMTPLEPIRVELERGQLATIDMTDQSRLALEESTTGYAANERILQLLESNNAKLDGMQQQIDVLRSEQLKLWQQQQDEKNLTMQKQIDDLREMVFALVKMNSGDAIADGSNTLLPPDNRNASIANVPGSMNVYFAKGSTKLDAGSVLSLNEVVDILGRTPQLKLMVTGFADRSGDPARNLVLSQQRAGAVKEFLVDSGLNADRFITKYYGDRDSQQESSNDRRVMVEFVRK